MNQFVKPEATRIVRINSGRLHFIKTSVIYAAENNSLNSGWLLVRDGLIRDMGLGSPALSNDIAVMDLSGFFLTPGSPGVTIGCGLRQEMTLLRRAGYTGKELLAMATNNAAELFPNHHRLSKLTIGGPAFF
ncbi:MAG: hypothetical protein HQK55_06320 [Deltaproteobacteria bacterium]|nr:hypothetical protein [Deltaproteobacteria bacterium]